MQKLSTLKFFVLQNLPDTLQRRELINLINNEIQRSNGDEQAVIFRASDHEAREFIDFKNRKHLEQINDKSQIKTALIQLKGSLHPELKNLNLKEGDQIQAQIYSSNKAAQFSVSAVGTTWNCSVWPENYDVVLTQK